MSASIRRWAAKAQGRRRAKEEWSATEDRARKSNRQFASRFAIATRTRMRPPTRARTTPPAVVRLVVSLHAGACFDVLPFAEEGAAVHAYDKDKDSTMLAIARALNSSISTRLVDIDEVTRDAILLNTFQHFKTVMDEEEDAVAHVHLNFTPCCEDTTLLSKTREPRRVFMHVQVSRCAPPAPSQRRNVTCTTHTHTRFPTHFTATTASAVAGCWWCAHCNCFLVRAPRVHLPDTRAGRHPRHVRRGKCEFLWVRMTQETPQQDSAGKTGVPFSSDTRRRTELCFFLPPPERAPPSAVANECSVLQTPDYGPSFVCFQQHEFSACVFTHTTVPEQTKPGRRAGVAQRHEHLVPLGIS